MGGEGSMASAIVSLRQNRALLKKRKFKDIKELVYEKSNRTKLEFKKISAREMVAIKLKIRKEAKRSAKIEMAIYLISTILTFLLMYSLYYWLSK